MKKPKQAHVTQAIKRKSSQLVHRRSVVDIHSTRRSAAKFAGVEDGEILVRVEVRER